MKINKLCHRPSLKKKKKKELETKRSLRALQGATLFWCMCGHESKTTATSGKIMLQSTFLFLTR